MCGQRSSYRFLFTLHRITHMKYITGVLYAYL
nr:MAG TPA: hypothetical protein [Caudoviricetes sp.]